MAPPLVLLLLYIYSVCKLVRFPLDSFRMQVKIYLESQEASRITYHLDPNHPNYRTMPLEIGLQELGCAPIKVYTPIRTNTVQDTAILRQPLTQFQICMHNSVSKSVYCKTGHFRVQENSAIYFPVFKFFKICEIFLLWSCLASNA